MENDNRIREGYHHGSGCHDTKEQIQKCLNCTKKKCNNCVSRERKL